MLFAVIRGKTYHRIPIVSQNASMMNRLISKIEKSYNAKKIIHITNLKGINIRFLYGKNTILLFIIPLNNR